MSQAGFDEVMGFYRHVADLKRLVRKGWELRGVPAPESVADHSLGVALLAMMLARGTDLDVGTVFMTAAIHDLAESVVGDVVPSDVVDAGDKSAAEEAASEVILAMLDPSGHLLELWRDFEYARTPEGALVKDVDRLEMAFQAEDYESLTGIELGDFFPYVEERLTTERGKHIFHALERARMERRRSAAASAQA